MKFAIGGLLVFLLFSSTPSEAQIVMVKNETELKAAIKNAKPGTSIVLKNGEWKNLSLLLDAGGTKDKPITIKAETAGRVRLTGKSMLKLGGAHITVDGLHFVNGYAGQDAVIDFRLDKNKVANHCRVTNTVIDDFNNPKRMDENYWVSFYGKSNRLDHCSFVNKKNMGVLLAVILDDDRSRENFHSIDHNYFGIRLPLASNTGEIVRVGVSQHCEFNSNTQITDNFFERCDGETEIISLKSGSNVIRNNLFKECQGAVVLRHGNHNTVENNIFLGNNKEGTGGVRIINEDQWVVNNLFYQCRGTGFRSPLSVMNGVPNSPAFRYVTAANALVANNSFYACAPVSFCEGSDTERVEPPKNIAVLNNVFYNNKNTPVYLVYDKMDGFRFSGNLVKELASTPLLKGFREVPLAVQNSHGVQLPVPAKTEQLALPDSLKTLAAGRLFANLSAVPGYAGQEQWLKMEANAYNACGAKWFKSIQVPKKRIEADCATAGEIVRLLAQNGGARLVINLTGKRYTFEQPLSVTSDVTIRSNSKQPIDFVLRQASPFLIQVNSGNKLSLQHLSLNLEKVLASAFISTDTSGSANHSQVTIVGCSISGFNGIFFYAAKESLCDSIIIEKNKFTQNSGMLFNFLAETDKKGYYNVEKLVISHNDISNHKGQVLAMLRSGNDESTMGPSLTFAGNIVRGVHSGPEPLIHLYGTQLSILKENKFIESNAENMVVKYEDAVRAKHILGKNEFKNSGVVLENKYVERSE